MRARGNFKNFGAVFGIFPLVHRVEYWIPLAIRRGIVRMVFHGSPGFRDTTGRHHHHGFGRLSVLDSSTPKISDIGPAVLRLNTTLDAVRIGERYWIRWFERWQSDWIVVVTWQSLKLLLFFFLSGREDRYIRGKIWMVKIWKRWWRFLFFFLYIREFEKSMIHIQCRKTWRVFDDISQR